MACIGGSDPPFMPTRLAKLVKSSSEQRFCAFCADLLTIGIHFQDRERPILRAVALDSWLADSE